LTHGVEVDAWAKPQPVRFAPWQRLDRPTITFWGLIDARLDRDWCLQLIQRSTGSLMLAGPVSEDAKQVRALSKTYLAGPVPHDDLPAIAERSDVLVMPYRDLPVTRAMQPLKLLEYLATYKPVVVRDLPATRAWADCCDVVSTADDFVRVCLERAKAGLPAEQRAARERRLPGESWSEKARQFERILLGSR
jgi:glycosyltransferase involved in cell wall biosynthesis